MKDTPAIMKTKQPGRASVGELPEKMEYFVTWDVLVIAMITILK